MSKLTKSELMALDLLIQVMKDEQLGIQANEAAFIGGIIRVTRRVVNVTRRITPVLRVVTQVTPAIAGGTTTRLTAAQDPGAEDELDPEISLEALIAIREALTRNQEK